VNHCTWTNEVLHSERQETPTTFILFFLLNIFAFEYGGSSIFRGYVVTNAEQFCVELWNFCSDIPF
jgi:hypothetical protein